MEHWELIARESIRDLAARYNANGDSGRIGPMLDLFAEDALLEISGEQTCRGRDEIRGFFESVLRGDGGRKKIRVLRHFIATHQIDVLDQGEARGRCYFAVLTEDGLDAVAAFEGSIQAGDGIGRVHASKMWLNSAEREQAPETGGVLSS